ncbi:MAG: type IV pilin [Candidatus Verstraetearchaeota archaeon]|nr:type IV pilin [Candidatus Verstraetearchaeota archaeon]
MNINLDRRGVSPIIATLLLIVIAVAAVVVTYTFVMGFVGTGTQTSTNVQGQLTYDSYSVNGTTSSSITAYIRNTGGKAVVLNSVYVDGVKISYNSTANSESQIWTQLAVNTTLEWAFFVAGTPTTSLDVASVGTLYIESSNPAARTQTIRIVCEDGTTLEFAVRK